MSVWRNISEVRVGTDLDRKTLIVTDGVDTCALAFCEGGDWYLGEADRPDRIPLDFQPEFWLPRAVSFNPFHADFPDRRGSIFARNHPSVEAVS